MKRRTLAVSTLIVVGVLGTAPVSKATFPGPVGKIDFASASEVSTVNPDGSGLEAIRVVRMTAFDPAWSPDGNKIAFVSSTGAFQAIWVMNPNGTIPQQVSMKPAGETASDTVPAWSPDGQKIAFHRAWTDAGGPHNDIFVVNVDGTGMANLTGSLAFDEDDPAWSPDGSKIAFVADTDIWAMNADGSSPGKLTQITVGDPGDPSWSPDGSKIIWTTNPLEGDIMVMAPDGTGPTEIRPGCSGCETWDVAWSPDGTKIGFIQDVGGDQLSEQIWVMNANGTGEVAITQQAGTRLDWGVACTRNCVLPPECRPNAKAICGSDEDDALRGTSEDDAIFGVTGDDSLDGRGGNDTLDGGAGSDALKGGPGDDTLKGGPGDDFLNGGSGKDKCIISKGERTKSCERVITRRSH
jgi:WD40 repeat protein